jgi:hypothetical protein
MLLWMKMKRQVLFSFPLILTLGLDNKVSLSFSFILTFGLKNIGKSNQMIKIKSGTPILSFHIDILFGKHREK